MKSSSKRWDGLPAKTFKSQVPAPMSTKTASDAPHCIHVKSTPGKWSISCCKA